MTTPVHALAAAQEPVLADSDRKLRIAHLTATFPPYLAGAGNVCLQLAEGLARRGHDVEVVTAPSPGVPPPTKVRVRRVHPLVSIGNAPMIPAVATLGDYDVVHLHYPFIFGTELLLSSRTRRRTPIVVSYHNRLIGQGARRPMFYLYEETWGRALARRADRILVVSEAHARTVNYLRGLTRRDPSRVHVMPNGVDTERFRPGPDTAGTRRELGIPTDALVMVFIATLDRAHYFKRLDLALEGLAATDTPAHLLVVGGGEWTDHYRGQAADRGLSARVHFLGRLGHDRLPDVLRAADGLLLTSDLESFGMVLLEAMASALPTIATDLPGVRAVVDAPRTGLLVERNDPVAVADAIDRLAELGPAGRALMGAAGRRRCEETYGWPSIVERLEAIYREVLSA